MRESDSRTLGASLRVFVVERSTPVDPMLGYYQRHVGSTANHASPGLSIRPARDAPSPPAEGGHLARHRDVLPDHRGKHRTLYNGYWFFGRPTERARDSSRA